MVSSVTKDLIGASFFLALIGFSIYRSFNQGEPSIVNELPLQEAQLRMNAERFLPDHDASVHRRRLLAQDSVKKETPQQRKAKQKALMDKLVSSWRESQAKSDKKEIDLMPARTIKPGETLGPKIVDWDEQRQDYIKKHPKSNETRKGKPKTFMITGSHMSVCGNDVGDFLNLKSLKNKIDYCDPREIPVYASLTLLDKQLDSFWVKLPLLRTMMLTNPEVEWFWWMDSDAVFSDMQFDLPLERYDGYDFVLHGWPDAVFDRRDWVGLNAGVFLIRNSQWSLDFIDAWASFGVKGPLRKIWGLKLTQDLTNRPVFDSDDQSVLVWMLYYQKEKWAHKVFLESTFYLHGYWIILTQRYEELMDKYHPGHGDHRWPLITHFVGCKPCSKVGALVFSEMKKCVEGMERAFNFADNQVLRKFGYQHLHLDTFQVVRINVTTYKASEFTTDPLRKYQVDS